MSRPIWSVSWPLIISQCSVVRINRKIRQPPCQCEVEEETYSDELGNPQCRRGSPRPDPWLSRLILFVI